MKANEVKALAVAYARAKAEVDSATKALGESAQMLVEAMTDADLPAITVRDAYDGEMRVVVVRSSTVVTDYEALGERLDPKVYKETLTTKTYVDPAKVEALVALGKIKAEDVADVSEVKPRKPYLKQSGVFDIETIGGRAAQRKGRLS